MSRFLWKYYLQDDLESFQQLLANANFSGTNTKATYSTYNVSAVAGSPGKGLAASPVLKSKLKGRQSNGITLTRGDLNWKDHHGRTLLHHIATSNGSHVTEFALAMLKVPLLDLYAQDLENGWTPLHRALYYGNITIARALMARDIEDAVGTVGTTHAGGLIKIKDKDGCSPFDVYNDTISSRILEHGMTQSTITSGDEIIDHISEDSEENTEDRDHAASIGDGIDGDELYMFGTNKNYNLGFIDGDDRHFPEKPAFHRPSSLVKKHYHQYLTDMSENASLRMQGKSLNDPASIPAVVRSRSLRILDVRLAKLHSAILTTDAESNLYVCGFGADYRLGTGDDRTVFSFTCITGGGLGSKKIISVALGLNHTLVVTSEGETYSWGSNVHGQLGYALAKESNRDDDQVQPLPRQIFGPLKREFILGCAASRTHSVVHTKSSLFTFGKNEGQLGLVDADARSLEIQVIPRQVALSRFSSPIVMVSAIDKATICLLENHDVLVFANYGYSKLQLPLDSPFSSFARGRFFISRRAGRRNYVVKICSGGNTICALTSEGEVLTVALKSEPSPNAVSTTNPSKIRDSVSATQKLWSIRKSSMAAVDVDVGQDGSVIICTSGGSVWRREKRAKIKDADTEHVKDYKFSRVPGLTKIAAVRSNAFGAFAAIRKDCDVLRTQLIIEPRRMWKDLFALLPLRVFVKAETSDTEEPAPRFWRPKPDPYDPASIRRAIVRSTDLEKDLAIVMDSLGSFDDTTYDLKLGTKLSDIRIPIHSFLLAARSPIMRSGLNVFAQEYFFSISDVLTVEYDKEGHPVVIFQALDILSLLVLVFYIYTDGIIDVWHMAKKSPSFAYAYRQARSELMKLSAMLELKDLERATRLMTEPNKVLHRDLDRAIADPLFFNSGDIEVKLDGDSRLVHSALICKRCPFFEGLFFGRARGGWLSQRRAELGEGNEPVTVDLSHMDPAIFDLVLRYLYADVDEQIFEDVVASDQDEFLDLILDVTAAANELMLDRLAQTCQKVLGSYVTTRNVCQLLNAVAPCSVIDFKETALEYLCLNLEGMLENGLLDELDEDLMIELDAKVQENQIAKMPFSRGHHVEDELLERYPELAAQLERDKQILIDSVALKSRLHEDEARADKLAKSVAQHGRSPQFLPRTTSSDLLFEMDEDGSSDHFLGKTSISPRIDPRKTNSHGEPSVLQSTSSRKSVDRYEELSQSNTRINLGASPDPNAVAPNSPDHPLSVISSQSPSIPWGATPLSTSKLDMKQIMAQTSRIRSSGLSTAFANSESSSIFPIIKLSQKERRRQQREQVHSTSPGPSTQIEVESKQSPWQVLPSGSKTSFKDLNEGASQPQSPANMRSSSTPNLTLRQTIPGYSQATRKIPITPIPKTLPTKRTVSQPVAYNIQPTKSVTTTTPTGPHSVQHILPTSSVEQSFQLPMEDILAQQQREKQLQKEAAAKRSLLEIQEEQAFQDWWDKEEAATKARMQEEEEEVTKVSKDTKSRSKSRRGRAGGGRRGGGNAYRLGEADPESKTVADTQNNSEATPADHRGGHGSNRGRSSSRRSRRSRGPSK